MAIFVRALEGHSITMQMQYFGGAGARVRYSST